MSPAASPPDPDETPLQINISLSNHDKSYLAQPIPARVFEDRNSSLPEADTLTDDVPLTPRREIRREGFNWGVSSTVDAEPKHSRDPMPPAPRDMRTPPPLDEIIRSMTTGGSDIADDFRIHRVNSTDSEVGASHLFTSSTVGEGLQRSDTRRSSIAAFARGVAKHVPDMRIFIQPERTASRRDMLGRRDSQDAETIMNSVRDRKSSLALPSTLKSSESSDTALKSTPIVEPKSPPNAANTSTTPLATKGSLRDRRKVKLDLSLPTEIPDLPLRSRPPAITLSSITPSRPRSPKTPWIRNEPPSWDLGRLPRSAPIMEEGPMQQSRTGSGMISGIGLLPDSDEIISSQSPRFEHHSPRSQNRRYVCRPVHHRSRSGRSGTSDSGPLGTTPEALSPPVDAQALQEQQAQTTIELQQLSQTTRAGRQRRWWWRTSSDEGPRSPETTPCRFSRHLFKRPASCRTPSDTKTPCPVCPSSWRSKQAAPAQLPLAQIVAPPPFVPPGLQRVPTPPLFDADGEVKGKLADFFFDVHGPSGLRKRTPGARGIWDSDALLMSVETDLTSSASSDSEGPEGPAAPPPLPLSQPLSSAFRDPDLTFGTQPSITTPVLGRDKWFGVEPGVVTPPLDQTALTYLALQDEEAQRKFEWLVPEHLPTSPLCPLHRLYRGPCKGVCYWHGPRVGVVSRRSSGVRGRAGGK